MAYISWLFSCQQWISVFLLKWLADASWLFLLHGFRCSLHRDTDPEYFLFMPQTLRTVFCLLLDCLIVLKSASYMKCMMLFEEEVFLSLSCGRDPRRRWDILSQFSWSDLHLQIGPYFQGFQLLFIHRIGTGCIWNWVATLGWHFLLPSSEELNHDRLWILLGHFAKHSHRI